MTPTRTSLKLKAANSTAIAMSAAATRPIPPPNAWPFTAATMGFGPSQIRRSTSTNGLRPGPPCVTAAPPPFRSAPAQNAGGVPVRTMTRTAGSASAASRRSPSSVIICADSALRVAGDASVTHAAAPRTSYRVTDSVDMKSSSSLRGCHHHEHRVGIDHLPHLDTHLAHHTVRLRDHLVLHLHGLEHQQHLTLLHPVAGGDVHRTHDTGHRRHEPAGRVVAPRDRKARHADQLARTERSVDRDDLAGNDHGEPAPHAVDLDGNAPGVGLVQHGCRALSSRLDREARARLRDVAHLERLLTDPVGHALRPPPAVAPARRRARWHRTARW